MNEDSLEKTISSEKLELKIDIATKIDWEAFKDITIDAFTQNPEQFRSSLDKLKDLYLRTDKDWRDELAGHKKFFVVAKSDASVAGIKSMAGAIDKDGAHWNVISVYTRLDVRGHHITEKVLKKLLEEIKNRGGVLARLGVVKDLNHTARDIYERLGFIDVVSDKPLEYFLMEKDLTDSEDKV